MAAPPAIDDACVPPLAAAIVLPASSSSSISSSTDRGLAHIHWESWLAYLGAAAAARTVLLHPLTVAMARKRVVADHNVSFMSVLRAPPSSASSLDGHRRSAWWDGLLWAYRGFGVALVTNVFGEALYFSVLEYIRHVLEPSSLRPVRDSIGGFSAELASLACCTPMSVVCHRQMTAGFGVAKDIRYEGAARTARTVVAGTSGYAGLFAGFSVAVMSLPAAGIWWGIYSQAKVVAYSRVRGADASSEASSLSASDIDDSSLRMSLTSTRDNPVINAACGLGASVLTTLLFNPFNVVRTRLQATGRGSALSVARGLWRNEGMAGFMKGAAVSSCSAALEGSLTSFIYETSKYMADHSRSSVPRVAPAAGPEQ